MRLHRVEPGSYLTEDGKLIVLAHFADWAIWPRKKAADRPLARFRTLRECREWLNENEKAPPTTKG